MPDRVTVYLVPTRSIDLFSEGIDLFRLARYLNLVLSHGRTAHVIEFKVVIEGGVERRPRRQHLYRDKGLDLRQIVPFKHFKLADAEGLPHYVNSSYEYVNIVDLDALGQLKTFVEDTVGEAAADFHLILGIGSEVISDDKEGYEWSGRSEDDAYSCLGDIMSYPDASNEDYRPSRNVAFISLARAHAENVFGDPLSDQKSSAYDKRAVISRYLVSNIAHALSGFLFRNPLPREHVAMCVAATVWAGGERASYSAAGLCEKCQRRAMQEGLTSRYARVLHDPGTAIACIGRLETASRKIEADARFQDRFKAFLSFCVAAGLIGTFIALVVTYDSSEDAPLPFLREHWPAALLSIIFIGASIAAWVTSMARSRRIP